ncbi:MAG: IS3 family transposase, partial [Ruminobacter sp.]
ELKKYLDKYIQWYNNVRIKNTLGGLSPVQYRLNNVN